MNRAVDNRDFDRSILDHASHRPWPMPERPWVMTQTWHDLLFAHWRIDPEVMRAHVPEDFELDLYDGAAWLGIVSFYMTNVAPRAVPALPWISEFPELNVRTYVRVGGRSGVYFFSLDAGQPLAVRAARLLANLPYHTATMKAESGPDGVRYSSRRVAGGAEFHAFYRAVGPAFLSTAGPIEHFLTERYCLFHHHRSGTPYRLDIHHPPWLLHNADACLERNTMATANGLTVDAHPQLLHFAKRQDMVAWAPASLATR